MHRSGKVQMKRDWQTACPEHEWSSPRHIQFHILMINANELCTAVTSRFLIKARVSLNNLFFRGMGTGVNKFLFEYVH